MKFYFTTVDTTEALAITALDTIEFKIAGEWRRLETLQCLIRKIVPVKIAALTFGIWVDIDTNVQSVRYVNGAAATITPVIDPLAQGVEAYVNFNEVSVVEFQPGKIYLIPYTAGPVTDMIPDTTLVGVEGAVDAVLVGTHYMYQSNSRMQTRNGVAFTALVCELAISELLSNEERKAKKEVERSTAFTLSVARNTRA